MTPERRLTMAQAVTVQHGDTITRILKAKRGLKEHEIHTWRTKLGRMNPHISNLDRIYPGESVLIPDTLNENVVRTQVWQNAFCKIPRALSHPYHGATDIYVVQPGDTIDKVARYMFSGGPYRTMAASSKRALLIHNNPYLENHLAANRPPTNMLLNITPVKLSEMEKNHWKIEQTPLKMSLDEMEEQLRDMLRETGPEPTFSMAQIVEQLKSYGVAVGVDDVVTAAAYGTAGVSGHAAAGGMALNNVNTLARELYSEAVEKFGAKVVHSKSANHLTRMQNFLKSHPKYGQLMKHLKQLPRHLLPKGSLMPAGGRTHVAAARHFRKHISLPIKKWSSSSKYVGSMAKQLNGRVNLFKNISRGATWYVPAALGMISVASAPPELRMRTLFEEGFGVIGGAAGTTAGMFAGLGVIALLGLGPFGAFVAVFICASASGIIGMEAFKWGGGKIYDASGKIDDRVYHSFDEIVGVFNGQFKRTSN
jgi:hypothetical protein